VGICPQTQYPSSARLIIPALARSARTLLSNSVMAGVVAFIFSTVIITLLGEIVPQAYFSRHAMRTAYFLSPVLRVYQILLFPVAKSTAILLDKWLGHEAVQFFQEKDFEEILKLHIKSTRQIFGSQKSISCLP